jgi:hypothetical protein
MRDPEPGNRKIIADARLVHRWRYERHHDPTPETGEGQSPGVLNVSDLMDRC